MEIPPDDLRGSSASEEKEPEEMDGVRDPNAAAEIKALLRRNYIVSAAGPAGVYVACTQEVLRTGVSCACESKVAVFLSEKQLVVMSSPPRCFIFTTAVIEHPVNEHGAAYLFRRLLSSQHRLYAAWRCGTGGPRTPNSYSFASNNRLLYPPCRMEASCYLPASWPDDFVWKMNGDSNISI